MKINKNLKFADFSYDDEAKTFTISDKDGHGVELNKVYSFAFLRFVVRISQRNWLRGSTKIKKALDKPVENVVFLEDSQENPNQLFFTEIENEPTAKTLASPQG